MTSRTSRRFVPLVLLASIAASSAIAATKPDPFAVLDGLQAAGKPVMFAFTDETIDRIFVSIEQATGLTITVEAKGSRKINVQTGKVPLKEALVRIGNENGLVYDVIGPDRLIVRDRVPRPE